MVTVHGVEYWQVPDRQPTARHRRSRVHLLPGFDEYMLGYTDRSIQLGERRDYGSTVSANGMFSSTLVIDGRVEGTWRRTLRNDHVDIDVTPFRKLKHAETDALARAAERYGQFKGLTAVVHLGRRALRHSPLQLLALPATLGANVKT